MHDAYDIVKMIEAWGIVLCVINENYGEQWTFRFWYAEHQLDLWPASWTLRVYKPQWVNGTAEISRKGSNREIAKVKEKQKESEWEYHIKNGTEAQGLKRNV